MKKKFLSFLLLGITCLSILTGCGKEYQLTSNPFMDSLCSTESNNAKREEDCSDESTNNNEEKSSISSSINAELKVTVNSDNSKKMELGTVKETTSKIQEQETGVSKKTTNNKEIKSPSSSSSNKEVEIPVNSENSKNTTETKENTDKNSYCNHNYKLTFTKESTCSVEGYMEHKCSNCGATKKESLKLKECDYVFFETEYSNACKSNGYKIYKCNGCEATKKESFTNLDTECEYVYKETIAPSQDKHGKELYNCKHCGAAMAKTIHDYSLFETVKSTPEKSGYNTYKCKYCDKSYNETVYGEYVDTLKAPSVGLSVKVYTTANQSDSQKIVDAKNSAFCINYLNYGFWLIGDHNYQGFDKIKSMNIGDKVQFEGRTYECFEVIKDGYNQGTYLTNSEGICISRLNPNLAMYTCNNTSKNVTIVLFK